MGMNKHIVACTDNGGKTFDRYCVYLKYNECLGMSKNPDSPQGFSQFGTWEFIPPEESRVSFHDLPDNIKAHALKRINDL